MKRLGFPISKVIISGYRGFLFFFKVCLKEFKELDCLVSGDKLFHCLSFDGHL